jgi:hypothetical protein
MKGSKKFVFHAVIDVLYICTYVYIWTKKLNLEEDAIDESQCEIRRNGSYFIWSYVYLSKGVETLSVSKSN